MDAQDLHFTYPDGQKAIEGLTVSFGADTATGIVGANGAGKSTLLLLFLGILTPSRGMIALDDTPLIPANLSLFRQKIALTFQHPDDQLFMTKVGEDVAFGPRNMGLPETEVEERVTEALALVGMEHLRHRPPLKLSGGEKRAAAIATALAMRPEVLILDEPTSSLDPRSRRRVMDLLSALDYTKIITSHDLDMIMETCERVVVLRNGAVAAEGSSRELLKDADLLETCGLELPLTLQGCERRD